MSIRATYATASTLVAVLGLLPAPAAGLLIDDFSEGPLGLVAYGNNSTGEVISATQSFRFGDRTPLGDSRTWELESTNVRTPGLFGSKITVDPFAETFVLEAGPENHAYFELSYGDADGGGRFDLVESGNDRLRFRFAGADNQPVFQVRVDSVVGDETSSAVATLGSRSIIAPNDAIFEIPFDTFSGEADFRQVTSITLGTIRFPPGQRFALDSIEAVPSPIPGDLNRDGVVDLEDRAFWQASFDGVRLSFNGQRYSDNYDRLSVDGSSDGFINAADYTVWRDAFDATNQRSSGVPEPSAAGLLVFGAAAIVASRRRRQAGKRLPN